MHRRSSGWLFALAVSLLPLLLIAAPDSPPPPPLVWHDKVQIATGRGERGPWQQSASHFDFVDDPSVALDERGNVAVVWVDQASKSVRFQRYGADGKPQLERSVDVSRHPETFSWLPRIVLARGAPERVYVLWQEIIFSGGDHGGDILFARSSDGGASFAEPVNLTNSVAGEGKGRINRDIWHNGSLDLAAGDDGALYAAWTEYGGSLWFTRSVDGGVRFERPRHIAGGGRSLPTRAPTIAAGPDRRVYLAWSVGENAAGDIHIAASTDGGATFTPPRAIVPTDNYSDAPKLAVDRRGTVHLVHAESAAGPFARQHIRYARSTDGARTFEAPREISRPPPGPFTSAAFPSLALGADGGVHVIWELFRDQRTLPRGLGLAVSLDGGRSFSNPVVVPGSIDADGGFNGSSQGLLMRKLAVSSAGAVAIVNSSLKLDSHSRVWLMRASVP